ncbi:MAG: hypothetical protein AAB439_01300 [Patescibacteria group bacterium]
MKSIDRIFTHTRGSLNLSVLGSAAIAVGLFAVLGMETESGVDDAIGYSVMAVVGLPTLICGITGKGIST